MKRLIASFLTLIGLAGTSGLANAQEYPKKIGRYTSPASTLYRNEPTTQNRQNATLHFDRGGNLTMERNGLSISFSSKKIDESLFGKKVQVICANNTEAKNSIVVGNFRLPESPSFTCPSDRIYSFFWVIN